MPLIITFKDGETTPMDLENRNKFFNPKLVESLQADGPELQIITQLFCAVNRDGCTVFTIPISIYDSQRWYGDTAKTIIYALLQ